MQAYIEILSEHVIWPRLELSSSHLNEIGEFTRENVARWLNTPMRTGQFCHIGIYGWKDFHAVCGDIDIPWATDEVKKYVLPKPDSTPVDRGVSESADWTKSKGWYDWEKTLGYEICGARQPLDFRAELEAFCVLPAYHKGEHDYRADTGPW